MHTTEQRREIFKSCEKEMLFLHEIINAAHTGLPVCTVSKRPAICCI